jgi:disulfide oxidoreductase YuzD
MLPVLMAAFRLRKPATIKVEGKAMTKKANIKWQSGPQKHDYPAANSYLSLTMGPQASKNIVKKLQRATITNFAAKDIFRASKLSLLGVSNSHVEKDRTRIIQHEKLSPLMLFRDERNGKLIIADGYHRLCAVYTFDEDAIIPCKIV